MKNIVLIVVETPSPVTSLSMCRLLAAGCSHQSYIGNSTKNEVHFRGRRANAFGMKFSPAIIIISKFDR